MSGLGLFESSSNKPNHSRVFGSVGFTTVALTAFENLTPIALPQSSSCPEAPARYQYPSSPMETRTTSPAPAKWPPISVRKQKPSSRLSMRMGLSPFFHSYCVYSAEITPAMSAGAVVGGAAREIDAMTDDIDATPMSNCLFNMFMKSPG